MYSYAEQAVPVIVFPDGAPRGDGQHRIDNVFFCVVFCTEFLLNRHKTNEKLVSLMYSIVL